MIEVQLNKCNIPEKSDRNFGPLNLALIVLKQPQKEKGFRDISIEETMKQYNKNADTTTMFLEERCILDPGNPECYTITTNLRTKYVTYCSERNERPLDANVFGAKLKEHGIGKGRIRLNGIREYCYIGIKLKSDLEEKNPAPYQSIK
jgi:hypothetical protein